MSLLLDSLRGIGAGLTRLTERWVPDAWVICMILTVLALFLAIFGAGASPEQAVLAWGGGLWHLLELAMQFTLAMVAAYACVVSRPVFRLVDRLASLPNPERPLQAVALAALFSMGTAYLNWALCLVACALFVPFVCRRNPRVDIRVLIAASYLGLGTVWHGGLSGSAPLILATPGNPLLEPESGAAVADRLYPVTETLFATFNLLYLVVIAIVPFLAILVLHPKRDPVCLSREQVDAILPEPPVLPPPPTTPAAHLDAFWGFNALAALLILYPLGTKMVVGGFGTAWTIEAYNAVFLAAALLLHGSPISFLTACRRGLDSAWGIVVQFPFYAGIFGLMTHAGLGAWIGSLFVRFSSEGTFPAIVYLYSGLMNLFVPSAGSKWLIEAPFLLPAGEQLGVSTVTTLFAYAYGDSTTNLIQPFFAIPILAVARLRFGDIAGYTFLLALVCAVVSLAAMAIIPANL